MFKALRIAPLFPLSQLLIICKNLFFLQDSLKIQNNSWFLLYFKNINVNFMAKLNNLILVLDKLLVSIDHKQSFWVHIFEKESFIIKKKLMLCYFLLDCQLQLIQLLVFNFIALVLHKLINFFLYIFNLALFFFYLLH